MRPFVRYAFAVLDRCRGHGVQAAGTTPAKGKFTTSAKPCISTLSVQYRVRQHGKLRAAKGMQSFDFHSLFAKDAENASCDDIDELGDVDAWDDYDGRDHNVILLL